MRLSQRCKLLLASAPLAALLTACPSPPRAPAVPESSAVGTPAPVPLHLGTPYQIMPQASLLTILVYRAGPLASAGHNHVIASHDMSGTFYLAPQILQSSFEVRIPVATLTVDEAVLRAQQPAADFPADVSEGAKEGTRHNMLGAALLDAEHYPEITLRSVQLEPAGDAKEATVRAKVESSVRGQLRTFTLPVHYAISGNGTLEARGAMELRQTELGLTPFSAMLGALQVQDEMRISFHILAQAAELRRSR